MFPSTFSPTKSLSAKWRLVVPAFALGLLYLYLFHFFTLHSLPIQARTLRRPSSQGALLTNNAVFSEVLGSETISNNKRVEDEDGVEDTQATVNTETMSMVGNLQDDGCGVRSSELGTSGISWAPYDSDQQNFLLRYSACMDNVDGGGHRGHQYVDTQLWKQLQCQRPVDVAATVQSFENLFFVGDSVMRQMFFGLLCVLDQNVTFAKVLDNPRSQLPKEYYEYTLEHEQGTTVISYDQFGYLFKEDPYRFDVLTKGAFHEIIQNSTANDAIVVNGAAHYSVSGARYLKETLDIYSSRAQETEATMYYVEAHAEEWPTSNGLWFNRCSDDDGDCACESIDNERLAGRGALSGNVSYEGFIDVEGPPDKTIFEPLYPDTYASISEASNCVPNCAPASWRSLLARNALKDSPQVNIVPIFWQLVAAGFPTGKNNGDCTHKSKNALLEMDFQLIRTMQ